MIAGNDTGNGSASVLTDKPGCSASRMTNARRVGSASARKGAVERGAFKVNHMV